MTRVTKPSRRWILAAQRTFAKHRGKPKTPGAISGGPNSVFLAGLYRQGYTPPQAGKLMAYLALSEEGGNLSPFDYFNDTEA